MQTLRAENIVRSLHKVGITIAPTGDGGLRVSRASRLTPEFRGMIRESKAALLKYFTVFAANDPEPESSAYPNAWKELAHAYHTHHFSCPACITAGRGSLYGLRCDSGMELWQAYCD